MNNSVVNPFMEMLKIAKWSKTLSLLRIKPKNICIAVDLQKSLRGEKIYG
jgi:hypothetical protein